PVGGTRRALLFLNGDRLDRDRLHRPIPRLAGRPAPKLLDEVEAFDDLAEDAVLVVEPGRRGERNEELAAVGVGPRIRHRENSRLAMARLRTELVGELVAWSSRTRPERVAALNHETLDHAMKHEAVVVRPRDLLAALR